MDGARELAERYGLRDTGNFLISDAAGNSLSLESNAGGLAVVAPRRGLLVHANHAVGRTTAPAEAYPDRIERANSRYRARTLRALLEAERGRLTAQRALMCLADHSAYPRGLCRHRIGDAPGEGTSAAVVAEPAKGRLHVVRGPPCSNWPHTYEW